MDSSESCTGSTANIALSSPPAQSPNPPFDTNTIPSPNANAISPPRRASISQRVRSASIKFLEADLPPGIWAATGVAASRAPTYSEFRRGSYTPASPPIPLDTSVGCTERSATFGPESGNGDKIEFTSPIWRRRRGSTLVTSRNLELFPPIDEAFVNGTSSIELPAVAKTNDIEDEKAQSKEAAAAGEGFAVSTLEKTETTRQAPRLVNQFTNPNSNSVPPPHLPWTTATLIALKAFLRWTLTPSGAFITIYSLNIVAWGGMLFLLLVNAAPEMCVPSCNAINSPRRVWIEIDSQILNALFCVTGFGLVPWRFRDLYFWFVWRLGRAQSEAKSVTGLRKLATIHRSWYRMDAPDATRHWKLTLVIWSNVLNTLFQAVLCGFMWGMTRFTRPSWATGLFIGLACLVAAAGGIVVFIEGRRVKKAEMTQTMAEATGGKEGDVEMGSSVGVRQGEGKRSKREGQA